MTTNHPPNPDRPPGAGDTPAPAVFDRFTARLLALARQQLGAWLRARVDPEEIVQGLLRGLGADERPIIELSLQGYSTQEISEQVGRAERSVRRLRERVRDQLEQARADDRP